VAAYHRYLRNAQTMFKETAYGLMPQVMKVQVIQLGSFQDTLPCHPH
jgi:hypothetical protein